MSNERINIRMKEELYDYYANKAENQDESKSQVMRKALDRYKTIREEKKLLEDIDLDKEYIDLEIENIDEIDLLFKDLSNYNEVLNGLLEPIKMIIRHYKYHTKELKRLIELAGVIVKSIDLKNIEYKENTKRN